MSETGDNLSASQGLHLCRLREESARPNSYRIVAVLAFLLLMGANMPTPLYQVYRELFGFSDFTMTVVFGVYSLAVIPALFVFGPVGDIICRRRALLLAISTEAVGIALIAAAQSLAWLLAGRFIIGIAIGISQGNLSAALVEMQPHDDRRRAGVVILASTVGGVAAGPLVAGALAQYLPEPLLLTYIVELFLLAIVFVMVITIPEEAAFIDFRSLRIHRPRIPKGRFWRFLSALVAGGLLWSIAGIFLALVPSYVSDLLRVQNLAAGGAVVALMMGSGIAGQLLLQGRSAFFSRPSAWVARVLGLGALVAAWPLSSLYLMFAGAIVCGAGAGIGQLGSISELNEIAPPEERGAVNSLYFVMIYLFFAVPAVALGFTAVYTGLYAAVHVFAYIISALSVCCMAGLVLQRRKRHAVPP